MSMAQGMLQLYCSLNFSWRSRPMIAELMTKFSNIVARTPSSISVHRLLTSLYQLLSGLFRTLLTASSWRSISLLLSNFLSQSNILGRALSGSSLR